MEYLLNDEEGNAYVVGSEIWSETSYYTDGNGRSHSMIIDHHDDIFISKFTKEYKHIYNAKIPKRIIVSSSEDIPYYHFIKDGKVSFVFKDNKENIDKNKLSLKGAQTTYENNEVLGLCTLSKNGELERFALFDYRKEGYKRFRIYNEMVGATEMVLYCYGGKNRCIFTIIE